jgi:hypothetical protein
MVPVLWGPQQPTKVAEQGDSSRRVLPNSPGGELSRPAPYFTSPSCFAIVRSTMRLGMLLLSQLPHGSGVTM